MNMIYDEYTRLNFRKRLTEAYLRKMKMTSQIEEWQRKLFFCSDRTFLKVVHTNYVSWLHSVLALKPSNDTVGNLFSDVNDILITYKDWN